MTTRHVIIAAIIGALAWAIAVGAALHWRHDTPIPPREQTSIDSLKATQPAFDSAHTATKGAVTHVITKIIRDDATVARLQTAADHARARADSLAAAAARSADSASIWHAAYEARTTEAAQLQVAVDTLTRDLTAAKDTLARSQIQLTADAKRITEQINLTDRMASDLRAASPPCHVLYVFNCPSRTEAAFAGAAAAGAGFVAYRNRKAITAAIKRVIP